MPGLAGWADVAALLTCSIFKNASGLFAALNIAEKTAGN